MRIVVAKIHRDMDEITLMTQNYHTCTGSRTFLTEIPLLRILEFALFLNPGVDIWHAIVFCEAD